MRPFSNNRRALSRAKAAENFSGVQGDLFQRLEEPSDPCPQADLDIHYELLGAISHCIREARSRGLSRERIVDAMNRLLPELERPLTVRQLYAWTASSKEYSEFPARFLPAFCAAVGSPLPILVLARAIGRELIDAREVAAKRLGEAQIEAARLKREARELLRELGE